MEGPAVTDILAAVASCVGLYAMYLTLRGRLQAALESAILYAGMVLVLLGGSR